MTEAATPQKRTIKYDFKRPDKFSKDQIRTVAMMHETFARLASARLAGMLRCIAHVHVASVDQLTYEEFIRSIPNPTTLAIIHMDPLKGSAVFEIDPAITFAIIDRLFGGQGKGAVFNRGLTDNEQSVIEGIVERLLGSLHESWATVIDLKPGLRQIETNPQFAQIVPPTEMVVLVTLMTKVGESEGMMNFCIPYLTIEPVIPKLSAQYWYTLVRKPQKEVMITPAGIDVSADIFYEGERLSLREIGRLRKGSLVRVPGREKGEAFLRAGGKTLFRLEARASGRRQPVSYAVSDANRVKGIAAMKPPENAEELVEAGSYMRDAIKEFASNIEKALSTISNSISALSRKQDDMADLLSFGPRETDREAQPEADRRLPFQSIRKADPAHLLAVLQQEHPQTIALILSYLDPRNASNILSRLPAAMQPDVAARIASMERIAPEVLRDVEMVLEKKISVLSSPEFTPAGGVENIVEILNMSDRSTEKTIVSSLEKANPALAEEIKRIMFVFEDITVLDHDAIAKVWKKVDHDDMLLALKAAPEEVRGFVWEHSPRGETEKLKARFEDMGRVRLNEVEKAQQRIVAAIRELEEAGEIEVRRPSEEVG